MVPQEEIRLVANRAARTGSQGAMYIGSPNSGDESLTHPPFPVLVPVLRSGLGFRETPREQYGSHHHCDATRHSHQDLPTHRAAASCVARVSGTPHSLHPYTRDVEKTHITIAIASAFPINVRKNWLGWIGQLTRGIDLNLLEIGGLREF